MANSGLGRKKPFTLLAAILAFILLTLACITKQRACYLQSGHYAYWDVDSVTVNNDGGDDCRFECGGLAALKFVRYAQPGIPVNVVQVVRCPWENVTADLFLASSCLFCLWVIIEIGMTLIRKYWVVLNLILFIFVIPLGCVAAGFMLDDIQDDPGCNEIDRRNSEYINPTLGQPAETTRERCYRSIFVVSFIIQIVALFLFTCQLIYNFIIRKKMNEPRQKDEGYASVPAHQSMPTDPHLPTGAVATGPVIGGPVSGSENRIA